MRARRVARWRCRRSGHDLFAIPPMNGTAVLACRRCDLLRLVQVPPKDPEADVPGPLGDLAAGRAAVGYLDALRRRDWDEADRRRATLTERPVPALVAMGCLGEALLRIVASENGDAYAESLLLALSGQHDVEAFAAGIGRDEP